MMHPKSFKKLVIDNAVGILEPVGKSWCLVESRANDEMF